MYFDYDLFLQDLGSWVLANLGVFLIMFTACSFSAFFDYKKSLGKNEELKKRCIQRWKKEVFSKQAIAISLVFGSSCSMFEANLVISKIIFWLIFGGFAIFAMKNNY